MRPTTKLRALLKDGMVVAPGCFDPLSARLAQLAGFDALHMTGLGVEAAQLAAPDLGLLTMREIADGRTPNVPGTIEDAAVLDALTEVLRPGS